MISSTLTESQFSFHSFLICSLSRFPGPHWLDLSSSSSGARCTSRSVFGVFYQANYLHTMICVSDDSASSLATSLKQITSDEAKSSLSSSSSSSSSKCGVTLFFIVCSHSWAKRLSTGPSCWTSATGRRWRRLRTTASSSATWTWSRWTTATSTTATISPGTSPSPWINLASGGRMHFQSDDFNSSLLPNVNLRHLNVRFTTDKTLTLLWRTVLCI